MEQTFSTPLMDLYRVTGKESPQVTGWTANKEAPPPVRWGPPSNKKPEWKRGKEVTTEVGQFRVVERAEHGGAYIRVLRNARMPVLKTLEIGSADFSRLMSLTVAEPALADEHADLYGYQAPGWELFPAEPHPLDVTQGEIGNCRVASAMQAIANSEKGRERLRGLITSEGDAEKVFTVMLRPGSGPSTLPTSAAPVPERVSGYVPWSHLDDRPVYVLRGAAPGRRPTALWPAIIEKALARQWGGYNNLKGAEERPIFAVLGLADLQLFNWMAPPSGVEKCKCKIMAFSGEGYVLTTAAQAKQHNYALLVIDNDGVVVSDPNTHDEGAAARLLDPRVVEEGDVPGEAEIVKWMPKESDFPLRFTWPAFYRVFRWVYGAMP